MSLCHWEGDLDSLTQCASQESYERGDFTDEETEDWRS